LQVSYAFFFFFNNIRGRMGSKAIRGQFSDG